MKHVITAGIAASALLTTATMPLLAAEESSLVTDNSWISLSGTVVDAGARTFELDYGDGLVVVEMDDWDWYGEAFSIMEGDQVTVYGMVDDDLYETTSIEASSVYVKNLNTHFYASDADKEEVPITTASVREGSDAPARRSDRNQRTRTHRGQRVPKHAGRYRWNAL